MTTAEIRDGTAKTVQQQYTHYTNSYQQTALSEIQTVTA
jgi:hypothetical protein